jgi:site-specific recombinase XerD
MAGRRLVEKHAGGLSARPVAVRRLAGCQRAGRAQARRDGESDLNRYFSARHAATKATSANRRLTVFKRYFRWALRERFITADPTLKLQSAKQALRVPKVMSEAQVESLLARPMWTRPWACATGPCWRCCTPAACA